jgi:hypothetical protein
MDNSGSGIGKAYTIRFACDGERAAMLENWSKLWQAA